MTAISGARISIPVVDDSIQYRVAGRQGASIVRIRACLSAPYQYRYAAPLRNPPPALGKHCVFLGTRAASWLTPGFSTTGSTRTSSLRELIRASGMAYRCKPSHVGPFATMLVVDSGSLGFHSKRWLRRGSELGSIICAVELGELLPNLTRFFPLSLVGIARGPKGAMHPVRCRVQRAKAWHVSLHSKTPRPAN